MLGRRGETKREKNREGERERDIKGKERDGGRHRCLGVSETLVAVVYLVTECGECCLAADDDGGSGLHEDARLTPETSDDCGLRLSSLQSLYLYVVYTTHYPALLLCYNILHRAKLYCTVLHTTTPRQK